MELSYEETTKKLNEEIDLLEYQLKERKDVLKQHLKKQKKTFTND